MKSPLIDSTFTANLRSLRNDPHAVLRAFEGVVLNELNSNVPARHPYSRRVLYSGSDCEIMLARWRAGAPCAPHDHGASNGWVFYLEGSFLETSYAWSANSLEETDVANHPASSHTRVESGEIHSCVSPTGGLSLHVYFPRIERMKVYDVAERRTLIVSDDCGAWLPDVDQITQEIIWTAAHSPEAS